MVVTRLLVAVITTVFALLSTTAFAHVGLAGEGIAATTQLLTFGVGHGCEGADTVKIEIQIPKEVTTVRALPGPFGEAEVVTDDAGVVTAVVYSKAEARAVDDQYYQFGLRVAVPDAPFTTLYFPTIQTCKTADGEELEARWDAKTQAHDDEDVLPAPALRVVPAHFPGWNKYKADQAIEDLSVFDGALIVWSGDAAYSANPATTALIEETEDVAPLTEIKKGAEIWVKY